MTLQELEDFKTAYREDLYELSEFYNLYPVTSDIWQGYWLDKETLYIQPETMTYGDYVGSYYTKSNALVFAEEFKDQKNESWEWHRLAHHTDSILINITKASKEMLDFVFYLQNDYPIADEMHAANIEQELRLEAWEGCYQWDFESGIEVIIEEKYGELYPDDQMELIEGFMDFNFFLKSTGFNSDESWEFFNTCLRIADQYWYEDSGCGQCVDVRAVLKEITFDHIINYFKAPSNIWEEYDVAA